MNGEALRLDGNAAAGILSEVFVPDLTTANATCANCGTIRAMGALPVYAHGMGTVMRCPSCDAVMLRVARTRTKLWLDLTGARLVVMAAAVDRALSYVEPRTATENAHLPPQEGEHRWPE